jgi:CheY-like chemotaxis protein
MKSFSKPTGLRLHALVVDDNENMRSLLCRLLQRVGITSLEFSDGSAALAAVPSVKPDFIVTDLTMAPMDGLTFASKLRESAEDQIRLIPIIMVTGHTERRQIEAARDHGVNEILAKPVTAAALVQRIEEIIQRPRPFVRTQTFFGPDRRRRRLPDYAGPERRKDDPPQR